ncbi:MAG: MFS transporter [Planctomycetaceae bacterium]|nr:MFS transporter [Planctomycetaceae bacterium]
MPSDNGSNGKDIPVAAAPVARGRLKRLFEFLGLKRSIAGMLGMVVLVGMGEHMAERYLPLYLTSMTGQYGTVVGVVRETDENKKPVRNLVLNVPGKDKPAKYTVDDKTAVTVVDGGGSLDDLKPGMQVLVHPRADGGAEKIAPYQGHGREAFSIGTYAMPLAVLAIGLLAGLDDLLSALYSFPGGYLSDRLGTKLALLVFNMISMIGYVIVILVPTWWAVLLGAAFFISWSAISLPATMELISKVVPKTKRTMGVSVQSLVRRIPKTLGPFVGGSFVLAFGVASGVRLAFVFALGLAVVAAIIQQAFIEDDRPTADDLKRRRAERSPWRLWPLMNTDLRALLTSDILIRFCERIPDAFVILWVTQNLEDGGMSIAQAAFWFGVLSVIENVTAVLCYVPVAHYADRFGKKPFVAITFGFFTLFPLALYFSTSLWPLVAAFVLRGLKEFGEPTRKALIMDLAPEDRKAAIFGLYYLLRDVLVSVAAFGGAWLWAISAEVNLLTAFIFGVIGTMWFIFRGRDLQERSPAS